jgi:serine/threonine protein kinase/tetratricopeptide (TPR) repeat protein
MVECPVCHARNPPGSLACFKCSTPIEIGDATLAINPAGEAATIVEPAGAPGDPEATIGGTTGWSVPIQKTGPRDPNAPLEPGTVLGERYEILKRLGEGGMGAVYKARDRELDRLLALKVIRPELAGHPDILRRFKQELILARQVTHKNVIRIFDLGMAGGCKFITMDYIDGRDLKSILVERGKLAPEEAVPIVQQICRGLEAAHTEGVVHRDLKPQNIMVDASGRVWVMDFGLARSMEMAGMTRTGALMGTPDYMSPEQARAEKVDARSDLFSLGIIFYEMLTGVLPFQADTMMATLLKRVQEKTVPPNAVDSAIPRRLSDVVMKCLEADRAKRYQTTGEILADLAGDAPPLSMSGSTSASVAQTSPVSLAAMEPGAQFGPRYRIESVIGEGGMGKVYKAHDNDLDRTVALKLVRQELANNAESMQRFKQELLLASRISHKNILRIHDLGDVGGVKFISMAYVQGRDLHDVIAECGRLPVDRAVHIAKQLAGALEAAHAEGVVHRDLKPRNVLVDQADQVYVSDFGLAKSLESVSATAMTRTGEVLGTPRYMSPEQAESKPVDHRSDIYSFGVMLYEMVTGDAPFAGESMLQVMYQHVSQKPKNPKEANPELPGYLAQIILRCLEKDPALRYQSAREILHDLESATPPTRVVRLRIAETGYPKWLIAAMAVLLVVGGGLLVRPVRDALLFRPARGGSPGIAKDKYIAVLPLKVLGKEEGLQYVADGVVDSLSAQLFQLKNVYVAPQSAVETAVKKGPVEKEKVARQLGVNLIVDGTVQGAGDRVGIVIQVEDVKNAKRLWSKEFSPLRRDILTAQNSIYSELVSALDLKDEDPARAALRLTGNYGAYEFYLKGRDVVRRQPNATGYHAALNFFDQAIQKDPRFALAYAGRADTSMAMYMLTKEDSWAKKALSAAEQAKQLNPDLPEVHWALGTVYLQTGKTEDSIAETKLALELAPSSDESYRRLGTVYLAAGRKEAIAAYEKAVEINPYYWYNFNWLGVACFRLGEVDKAVNAFRRVTELAPDWADGYNNLGGAYFEQGKWNEAVEAYRKSLSLDPNGGYPYANLGTAFYYLGQYSDAAKSLEKAVELDPTSHENVAGLADAYLQLGRRDKAMSNYETAIKLALKAYQVNTRDAMTLGPLALYYAKKGDLNRAENFIAKAREIDATNNVLIYNDAMIQALSGKPADALKLLREAVKNGFSVEMVKSDPELASLRSTPEFEKLIKDFSRKAK